MALFSTNTESESTKTKTNAVPFSSQQEDRLFKDGRRWFIRYQIGGLLPYTYGFCIFIFREELNISKSLILPAILLLIFVFWCVYTSWLARLTMHSFMKIFDWRGLLSNERQFSLWFQILPSWMQKYEAILEAKSDFLRLQDALYGSLIHVHELRNYIQPLIGYLDVALDKSLRNKLSPATKDEIINAIEESKNQAEAIHNFVSSLHGFVIDNKEQEQFDLWAVIEMSVENRPDPISIDSTVETPLMVWGCKPIVQQVIANVISNGCKYGKKNKDGKVEIFITQPAGRRQATVLVYDGGENRISSNGCG